MPPSAASTSDGGTQPAPAGDWIGRAAGGVRCWCSMACSGSPGALGGLLLAAAYRQFNIRVLKESVFLTAKTSAMLCWLFVGSLIFSAAFALLGG